MIISDPEITETPEEIVRRAEIDYGVKKFVGLFSGGKDSLVTCHYLWRMGVLDEVLYCKTGVGVKENFEYVLETCNKYGWRLHVEAPEPRFSYDEFVRRWGFPHRGVHGGVMNSLKWQSIRRYNRAHPDEHLAFVSGRRTKESWRRGTLKGMQSPIMYAEGEAKRYPLLTVAPLYYWRDDQIWQYVKDNSLETCPVYKTLHLGGDCLCGCYSELGEAELIAIFHPELAAYLQALEKKYGGKWGSQSSITGAKQQRTLSEFVQSVACTDCMIDSQKKVTGRKRKQ